MCKYRKKNILILSQKIIPFPWLNLGRPDQVSFILINQNKKIVIKKCIFISKFLILFLVYYYLIDILLFYSKKISFWIFASLRYSLIFVDFPLYTKFFLLYL